MGAVGAHIRTPATSGSLGTVSGESSGMSGVVAATSSVSTSKPNLIFYGVPSSKKNDPAARKCQEIEQDILFLAASTDPTPRAPSAIDFRAAVASKAFNVVYVDVSNTTSGPVTAAKAPLIVITNAKGEVKANLSGSSITASSLYSAMASAMKSDGKDISKSVAKGAAVLSKMYANEVDIEEAKLKSSRSAKAQLETLGQVKEQCVKALAEVTADLKS